MPLNIEYSNFFSQKFKFQNNKEKTLNYVISQLSKQQHLYRPIS